MKNGIVFEQIIFSIYLLNLIINFNQHTHTDTFIHTYNLNNWARVHFKLKYYKKYHETDKNIDWYINQYKIFVELIN